MARAKNNVVARKYPCELCPLRRMPVFRQFTDKELEFVSGFKIGEFTAEAGTTILSEGFPNTHLYTVLFGWGFRYKTLPDGRRQILNYLLPGEFIGLQGTVFEAMQHSVEALTDMLLCVFERAGLWTLYSDYPSLAFDLTWLAAREEQILDNHLLSVGRRNALERTAYLLLHLYERATAVGLHKGRKVELPIRQQHLADTLGQSLVHTNKTLRRLQERKLIRWQGREFEVLEMQELRKVAKWEAEGDPLRPLL
jgi:CRP-like cAMP-binding protein